MSGKKQSRSKARRSTGFRSRFESMTATALTKAKVQWTYESEVWKYTIPAKVHKYRPDFIVTRKDGSVLIIETKGIFTAADRKKHLINKDLYPDFD